MTVPQSNENITQGNIRAFIQRGGPGPNNEVRFYGDEEQYLMVGDISAPDRGGVNAINIQDPHRYDSWLQTGYTTDPPDITSASLTFRQKRGGPPWFRFKLNCPINVYEVVGWCNNPSDIINGWNTMMRQDLHRPHTA
jgi:hypothetical protein